MFPTVIIEVIAEARLKFIRNSRYKVFRYEAFLTERIRKPCLTFKKDLLFAAI